MSAVESRGRYPQDIVALFHASFHPTKGNIIDWAVKTSDDLNLDHLEFSALPSGLHLVAQDVVYFNKDGNHGVCVFQRRRSTEQGHRGFRLSSLGILLAKCRRPRPWRHIPDLKDLMARIYSRLDDSGLFEPTEDDWELGRAFFEERKVRRADLGGAGDWNGWNHEFDEFGSDSSLVNPAIHLPHLLRILGPSTLTLHKHVLGRRRILIYTLPPVEAACILCQVAADICYEAQRTDESNTPQAAGSRVRGRCRESINVLGMVTLNDIDRMRAEGRTGRGWIACTTDAIFLEKPSCYDLLVDLTTSTPNKATRPTFYISKTLTHQPDNSRALTHRLSTIRFAWSDVKLWNELDRILQLDTDYLSHSDCCGHPPSTDAPLKSRLITTWTDAWRVYEDVCIICAGLWMGSWRSNSTMSYSTADGLENWGKVRLEGDDDLSLSGAGFVRSLGLGIEGGPASSGSGISGNPVATRVQPTNKPMSRSSGMSWSSGRSTVTVQSPSVINVNGKARQMSLSNAAEGDPDTVIVDRRDGQIQMTLSLLQIFHTHTSFQLSVLESFVAQARPDSDSDGTVMLTPKDMLAFELGPLSDLDAKYLGWLAREYSTATKVVVRRGWKDLLGVIFGYG